MESVDAVVVGAGACVGLVAKRLAEAGMSVLFWRREEVDPSKI
jgi:choline dehydrogenase-like flavoprotein